MSGASDISIGIPSMNYQRFHAVHFTLPFYQLEYGFCAMPPRPIDPILKIFNVFQVSVWISIIVAVISISLAFFVFNQTYRYVCVQVTIHT